MIIYAVALVLIGVSIGSSGKTNTTNSAASKPAPAATVTVFETLPGPYRQGDDHQVSADPDRNCDGLAFAAAAGAARAAAIIGCPLPGGSGRRFVPPAQQRRNLL